MEKSSSCSLSEKRKVTLTSSRYFNPFMVYTSISVLDCPEVSNFSPISIIAHINPKIAKTMPRLNINFTNSMGAKLLFLSEKK